jgi:GNAT superfamily N-acetyltransferase
MAELVVKCVGTRREKKQFLEYPWALYRNDPNWVPPLRMDQKALVGYTKHPFYERNQAQTFLAYRDGVVCGRIAAILNQGHIDRYGERRGFFGFFDCADDQEAASGLFDAVRQWFAERDIHCLRGPHNPSQNYTVGLLIDGFDTPPTFMMTYNRPYYAGLIEKYGFRKSQDLYAYSGDLEMLPKVHGKLAPVSGQIVERLGLHLRTLNKKRFLEDVKQFLSIYNRSMASTWGFVEMTEAEMKHMANDLQYMIVPDMAIAAEVNGEMIGAAFGLPDYNPRIKLIDGRLLPFGFIKLLWNRKAIKRVRLIATNVIPEYQHFGVALALLHFMVPRGLQWGLEEAEFSWVLESNSLSRGSLEKGGAKLTKTFRVYDLDQEPSK